MWHSDADGIFTAPAQRHGQSDLPPMPPKPPMPPMPPLSPKPPMSPAHIKPMTARQCTTAFISAHTSFLSNHYTKASRNPARSCRRTAPVCRESSTEVGLRILFVLLDPASPVDFQIVQLHLLLHALGSAQQSATHSRQQQRNASPPDASPEIAQSVGIQPNFQYMTEREQGGDPMRKLTPTSHHTHRAGPAGQHTAARCKASVETNGGGRQTCLREARPVLANLGTHEH